MGTITIKTPSLPVAMRTWKPFGGRKVDTPTAPANTRRPENAPMPHAQGEGADIGNGGGVRAPQPRRTADRSARRKRRIANAMRADWLLSPVALVRNYPFVLFLVAIGIGYIANSHYAVKNHKKIAQLERELKALHTEYIVYKADLADRSRQSKVSVSLDSVGVHGLTSLPEKIYVATQP